MKTTRSAVLAMALLGTVLCPCVWAQDADQSDLAQDLTNPVADLLTIPVQLNYDQNIGPAEDGWKLQTNIQPVLPFNVNDDWNLITRTIMPVIWQAGVGRWLTSPDSGPDGWRFRVQANFVLPKP